MVIVGYYERLYIFGVHALKGTLTLTPNTRGRWEFSLVLTRQIWQKTHTIACIHIHTDYSWKLDKQVSTNGVLSKSNSSSLQCRKPEISKCYAYQSITG